MQRRIDIPEGEGIEKKIAIPAFNSVHTIIERVLNLDFSRGGYVRDGFRVLANGRTDVASLNGFREH
jgi:hypothetical protein